MSSADSNWVEAQLVVDRGEIAAVSAQLFTLGSAGVQEDFLPGQAPKPLQPWDTGPPPPLPAKALLRAWFEEPDRAAIAATLGRDLRWSDVPDTDWDAVWRAGFEPIEVSERLVIAPPWDAPEGALIIEPGQGFGSGHHPSTLGALQLLDQLVDQASTAIDIGCGSGILALAAARCGCTAVGVDIDEAAIRDAEAQALRNGIVGVDFSTTPVEQLTEPADSVLANLFAEALVGMADHLVRLTAGDLVLAGVLIERERLVRDVLDHRLELVTRVEDGEWVALHYRRAP